MGKAKSLLATRENNRTFEGKIDFREISYLELLAFLSIFADDEKQIIAKALLYEHEFLDENPSFRDFLEFMANEYDEKATGEHYKIINDKYFGFAKNEYSLKIRDILKLSTFKQWEVTEHDINIYQNAGIADYIETDNSPNKLIIKSQWAMIDSLQSEISTLKAELEAGKANPPAQSDTPADGEPLALVFDSTNANYAPDLVHALNLWLDLYHRNPKDSDSHTNKANIWLKNNTAYEYVKRGATAMSRIREIATPLKDFGQQRAKEPKK